MIWIVLVLGVLCVALCVVALRYRNEYLRMHIVYQDHLNLYYDLQDKYQSVSAENQRFSNSISSLNSEVKISKHNVKVLQSSLKSEIDLKTLAEQRYEDERKLRMDAELRANELEKKLPKRDSKGRFVKRE